MTYKETTDREYPLGSLWRLRDNSMGIVVSYDKERNFLSIYTTNSATTITLKGSGKSDDTMDSPTDIIEPWSELKTGTFWINIYKDDEQIYRHNTREIADKEASVNRLACIEVKWTEGDGIDKTKGSSS